MKEILKYTFCLTLIFLIQTSCNNNTTQDSGNTDKVSKVSLIEKPIGESGYVLSIPADYSITTSDGPDFSVYYFSSTDTTIKNKLSGGLYFGNHPSEFEADNANCKTETLTGKILDNMQAWTVYNCQSDFSIQTIVDNNKGEGWNQKVHAFGHAKSNDDLQTILEIYSTLRKK
ncbi:hypothetical protein IPG41_03355 [Candidatus Peregrinibacteria bacterium]|nr:MAG: hypothetical protein IPG41_03355 [Candidatus Peregrinibacteria bacterium]